MSERLSNLLDVCFHLVEDLYSCMLPQQQKGIMTKSHWTDNWIFVSSPQVLYVPRHWWHYVESVDPITVSVNSWIELVRIPSRFPSTWTSDTVLSQNSKTKYDKCLPWRAPARGWSQQRAVPPDEVPSLLWGTNRPGSKRSPDSMMSVCAQRGVCAALKAPRPQAYVYSEGGSLSIIAFMDFDTTKCSCSISRLCFCHLVQLSWYEKFLFLFSCSRTESGWPSES